MMAGANVSDRGMAMDLDGRVAIVTGASRGIGAATAVALAQAGCQVACAARSTAAQPQPLPGTLDDTVERVRGLGGTAVAIQTNLAEHQQVISMVARTVEIFGRVDILINNAAVTFAGDLDQSLRRHQLTMSINYWAPYFGIQEVRSHMANAGGGAIVNISSLAALDSYPGLLSYGISKIALEHLTVDAARSLRPEGIAVNCFRVDIPVLGEGSIANQPGADLSDWEPCPVAAEGILWVLRQPSTYTGQRESMYHLRHRENIMVSRAMRPYQGPPPRRDLVNGL
jgi:citronellol/citronellal dehydrogenase